MEWWEGPHTWKWAVPAALALLLGYGAVKMMEKHEMESVLALLFACLFAAMALTNWWKLFSSHREDLHEQHMRALSETPLVRLSENMRQMHPEAIKVLNKFGVRTTWQVRVNASLGSRDWLLLDTNVHFGFIEFVISKSNGALYPKRNFAPGSYKWDPDGLVEDREQYDEFEMWLFSRMMVTRSHGEFKPAVFIPPWTRETILDVMGMTGEQDLYKPDETNGSNGSKPGDKQPGFIEKSLEDLKKLPTTK